MGVFFFLDQSFTSNHNTDKNDGKDISPPFSSSITSAPTNDASAPSTSPILSCALLPAIYYTEA